MERHLTGSHLSVQLVRLVSHPALCLWSLTGLQFVSRTAQLLLATTMCHKQPPDNQSNLDLWLWLCSWPAASRSQSRHFCLIYLPCTLLTVNCHLWRHQTRIQTTPTACVLLSSPPRMLVLLLPVCVGIWLAAAAVVLL